MATSKRKMKVSDSADTSSAKKKRKTAISRSESWKVDVEAVWFKEKKDGPWEPTIYLDEWRVREPLGEDNYDHPPAKGNKFGDVTSFVQSQQHWGPRRPHLDLILHRYERKNLPAHPPGEVGWLRLNDQGTMKIALNTGGNPIKDFKVLPTTLSSQVQGYAIEAYRRLDSRITLHDLRDRMPRVWNSKTQKMAVPGTNCLNMRGLRFRRIHRCIAWKGASGDQAFRDLLRHEMTAKMLRDNSTRELTALSKKHCAWLAQASYGTQFNRAGARKLSDATRAASWIQVSILTSMGVAVSKDEYETTHREFRGVQYDMARKKNPVGAKAQKIRREQDRVDALPDDALDDGSDEIEDDDDDENGEYMEEQEDGNDDHDDFGDQSGVAAGGFDDHRNWIITHPNRLGVHHQIAPQHLHGMPDREFLTQAEGSQAQQQQVSPDMQLMQGYYGQQQVFQDMQPLGPNFHARPQRMRYDRSQSMISNLGAVHATRSSTKVPRVAGSRNESAANPMEAEQVTQLVQALSDAQAAKEPPSTIIDILRLLRTSVKPTKALLQSTQVGKAVHRLKDHEHTVVARLSRETVSKWKDQLEKQDGLDITTSGKGQPIHVAPTTVSAAKSGGHNVRAQPISVESTAAVPSKKRASEKAQSPTQNKRRSSGFTYPDPLVSGAPILSSWREPEWTGPLTATGELTDPSNNEDPSLTYLYGMKSMKEQEAEFRRDRQARLQLDIIESKPVQILHNGRSNKITDDLIDPALLILSTPPQSSPSPVSRRIALFTHDDKENLPPSSQKESGHWEEGSQDSEVDSS